MDKLGTVRKIDPICTVDRVREWNELARRLEHGAYHYREGPVWCLDWLACEL